MSNRLTVRSGLIFGWRVAILMAGLFVFSFGIIIIVKGGLGLAAWDVLHRGISLHTPISFGQASQLTGFLVILVSFFLGVKPGLGTLCNMFFVGFWIDVLNNSGWIPEAAPLGGPLVQLVWVVAGILVMGLGSGLYLKPSLGAGPRDSFMLALVRRTGWRVAVCRVIMEVTVCGAGWLLGGPVGVATIMVSLGLGPAVELGFKICRVKVERHSTIAAPTAEPVSVA